jgi:hypothetical protein
VLAAAAIVGAVLALHGSNSGNSSRTTSGSSNAPIPLTGVSGYDPEGTGGEHDSDAPKATDGDPSTFWQTEHYASSAFGGLKSGVGIAVDAGTRHTLKTITVTSDTPGFTAEILAANSLSGPRPRVDSASRTVGHKTTFTLDGATARYYVVWITNLGGGHSWVDINEVTARG